MTDSPIKDRSKLRPYQHMMIEHIKENPACALWVFMGAGKTASTLTAVVDLMNDFEVNKTLVVAPLRVARKVWTDEISEWAHLRHLKHCTIIGDTKTRRTKVLTLMDNPADIYTINRENLAWLVDYFGDKWPFDTVILDEARSFQNATAKRFKALRRVRPYIGRLIELTGTPATNGLMGLWAQVFLLDKGKRLGKTLHSFRNKYFNQSPWAAYYWELKPGAEKGIHAAVKDICLTIKPEDATGTSDVMYNNIVVEMSAEERDNYETFKRDFILQINDEEITAVSAGVLWGKLLQLCNGAIYTVPPEWLQIHDQKVVALMETLEELVDSEQVLIVYNFKSDVERITDALERHPRFKKVDWRVLKNEKDEVDWNNGKVRFMLIHPAGGGHGLNLHKSKAKTIIHFGLNSDLDTYLQVNARLFGGHRGQGLKGVIHHIVCKDTVDEDVLLMLKEKNGTQQRLLEATKRVLSSVSE